MNPGSLPPMQPVKSSNLEAVGHTGDALVIRFKGKDGVPGPVWRYRGAPASYVGEIVKAESPGAMYHRLVKAAHYPGEKIE